MFSKSPNPPTIEVTIPSLGNVVAGGRAEFSGTLRFDDGRVFNIDMIFEGRTATPYSRLADMTQASSDAITPA